MKNKYNQYITYLKQIISNKLTCSKLNANINKKNAIHNTYNQLNRNPSITFARFEESFLKTFNLPCDATKIY